mmetsp:Transcript_4433/g.11346  ORF Transcript_4433/g.11346 Transcript_4433/m.11346 type:complete len:267 (-) Transcript_4433:1094-1894(-)
MRSRSRRTRSSSWATRASCESSIRTLSASAAKTPHLCPSRSTTSSNWSRARTPARSLASTSAPSRAGATTTTTHQATDSVPSCEQQGRRCVSHHVPAGYGALWHTNGSVQATRCSHPVRTGIYGLIKTFTRSCCCACACACVWRRLHHLARPLRARPRCSPRQRGRLRPRRLLGQPKARRRHLGQPKARQSQPSCCVSACACGSSCRHPRRHLPQQARARWSRLRLPPRPPRPPCSSSPQAPRTARQRQGWAPAPWQSQLAPPAPL